jgi:hypothetical protein
MDEKSMETDNTIRPISETEDNLLIQWTSVISQQDKMTQDYRNMLKILPFILQLQGDKGKMYGRSWCKHGDLSAFFNLERKWDRIQNIMEKAMVEGTDSLFNGSSDTATETFLDTVVDLGCYAMMWAGYIQENHPEMWRKFLQSNDLKA